MTEVRDTSSRSRFLWDAAHVVSGTAVSRIIINTLLESAEMNGPSTSLPNSVASQCCTVCGNLLTAFTSTLRWVGRGRGRKRRHRAAVRRGIVKCNVCSTSHCFPLKRTAVQQPQTSPLPSTPRQVPTTPRQAPTTPHRATSTPHRTPPTPHRAPSTPHRVPFTPHRTPSTPHQAPTHGSRELPPITPEKANSLRKKKTQRNNLKRALERQRSASEPITSPDLKSFLELLSSP